MKEKNKSMHADPVMLTANTTAVYAAMPFLRGRVGEYVGYDIPVLPTGILLGRDPAACHLIFTQTPDVSRYHCRVTYNRHTGYFVVTDLNSTNGIFTEDNRRLERGEKLVLAPGQSFKLCGEQIVFETRIESL